MNRRQFVVGLSSVLAGFSVWGEKVTWQTIPLWQGMPPGGGGPSGPVKISSQGALRNISVPELVRVSPERPNGYGVLIAAGGGYRRIEQGKEAWPAARWLAQRGFTAWILTYRLPGEGWEQGPEVALQDAQRALRIIRGQHRHCGVLGFSAGGHLLGLAVNRPGYRSYSPQDAIDQRPATAERAALIYPVITLEPPYTHTSTHRELVGPHASRQQDQWWSVQNYVTSASPPFFLVQAEDDPVSNPQNTLIMQRACQQAGVPVTLLRYPSGGHGFGMGRPGTETIEWPAHYQRWLSDWQNTAKSRKGLSNHYHVRVRD